MRSSAFGFFGLGPYFSRLPTRRPRLVAFDDFLVFPREPVDEAANLLSEVVDVAVVEPLLEAGVAEAVLDAGLGGVHGWARGQ